MKHPTIYYFYYLAGVAFVGLMVDVIWHMLRLWLVASHM